MIEDVLLALLGYTGDVIQENKMGFFLNPELLENGGKDETIVKSSQKHMVNRIVEVGYHYKALNKFIQYVGLKQLDVVSGGFNGGYSETSSSRKNQQQIGSTSQKTDQRDLFFTPGLYAHALAEGIEEFLSSNYRPLIAHFEQEVSSNRSCLDLEDDSEEGNNKGKKKRSNVVREKKCRQRFSRQNKRKNSSNIRCINKMDVEMEDSEYSEMNSFPLSSSFSDDLLDSSSG